MSRGTPIFDPLPTDGAQDFNLERYVPSTPRSGRPRNEDCRIGGRPKLEPSTAGAMPTVRSRRCELPVTDAALPKQLPPSFDPELLDARPVLCGENLQSD